MRRTLLVVGKESDLLDMLVEFGQRVAPWESEVTVRTLAIEYVADCEPPTPEQQVIDSEGLTERYRRAEGQ